MKSSSKEISHRRDLIFNELIQKGDVHVSDLSIMLKVSELTIRRDLEFFEQKRYIERFYGGARLLDPHDDDNPSQAIQKIRNNIAMKAASLIDSGDIIFINTSNTALLTLKYLENKEVTVITNNAKALFTKVSPKVTVILSGGELRNPKESMVGDFAINALNSVTASKAILGCSGLSLTDGITTSVHSEVVINQIMFSKCKGTRIIVADHHKFGNVSSFASVNLNDVDVLITDKETDQSFLNELQEKSHIEVYKV